MKHLIYILILLFAFGCGSKKTALKAKSLLVDKSTISQQHSENSTSNVTALIDTSRHRDVEISYSKIEFYAPQEMQLINSSNTNGLPNPDSEVSKPPDERLPVKSIENIHIKYSTAQIGINATDKQENTIKNDTFYRHNDISVTSKIEKKSERKESQLFKWLAWISICAAVITAIIYGYKIVNKFKK